MRPDATEGFGPVGTNGGDPVSLMVPIRERTEVDLIGALDALVAHFDNLPPQAKARAVRWLHAKYGDESRTGEGHE
jgi:hypothetical protein